MAEKSKFKLKTDKTQVLGMKGEVLSETKILTISREPNEAPLDTVWGVAELITRLDKNDPEYKFKVQAMIKRLVHFEKLSVYSRIHFQFRGKFQISTIKEFVRLKVETHKEWSEKSDKDIVT
jgi:hypothetical protein